MFVAGTWTNMTETQLAKAVKWGSEELQHTNQDVCWKGKMLYE